jgi:2-polyprenyl-3-methyl-5-hydroxy-6-metoxy-1,4-benzoquinol methylase
MMTANKRWAEALGQWAIPEAIVASAHESPWGFRVDLFVDVARHALAAPLTPTHHRVAEALPPGGLLLDVGAGAGAASLPVAPPGGRLVAVDQDGRMLEALAELAGDRVPVDLVEGPWPGVASIVGRVDVAVCANVAYNVADLGSLVGALTAAARHRVVLELSTVHPQASLSPLWQRFWGLRRPEGPTVEDAEAVVRETAGTTPACERWSRRRSFMGDAGPDTTAWVRRRLCLPPDRDGEVAAALEELPELAPSSMATLWWPGQA